MTDSDKVVFVVGPTATGKSAWALELAQKYDGTIVNIDSVQCYRGLEIGSAAPTAQEKAEASYKLYSYVVAPQEITAGQYLRDFYSLLEDSSLKFPLFITGGTGFYIQALEKGMYNVPEMPEGLKEQIENEILEFGNEKLYQELIAFDPATKIHVNDSYRLGRALEVKRAFNKKMSELQAEGEGNRKNKIPFPYIKIGIWPDAGVLEKKVQQRTDKMLADGMIDETKHFLDRGFADWAPLHSVGYQDVVDYLQNKIRHSELASAINQSTMQLIKKQRTWFKRDESILWSNLQSETHTQVRVQVDQFLMELRTSFDPVSRS